MSRNPRYDSRWGMPAEWRDNWKVEGMNSITQPSQGLLLRELEDLMGEAGQELRNFAEGRTSYIGYIVALTNKIQHCLADVGEAAQEELHELATMDLSISEGLRQWNDKGVFDASQAEKKLPELPQEFTISEFQRLQQEYDNAIPPKIDRMIALLAQVRDKMLGIAPPAQGGPAPAGPTVRTADSSQARTTDGPRKPYSKRDQALYELIKEDLPRMTDAELHSRYWWKWIKQNPGRSKAAFRSMLYRIRKKHTIPTPKL